MLYTGARTGEALWFDWRDVDLSRAHVQFLKTKTRQPRGVPLHPLVIAALAALPHREGEVFRRPEEIKAAFHELQAALNAQLAAVTAIIATLPK